MASSADIGIYGGAAGGGKSYALLLEPLRHIDNPLFRAVIFRRTSKQIRNEGGLWDAARKLYSHLGATAKETDLVWRFPSGATISFGSMEHEKNCYDWQGTEIAFLGFDELTHFTEKQFYYLLSRNRSVCGIRPYVRATCNPDADSWVARLIDWWIDDATGQIPACNSGAVRWFVKEGDDLHWSGNEHELKQRFEDQSPKSMTFVSASVEDNQILLKSDPAYRANLAALDRVERERLLNGNWRIRPEGGEFFRREWFSRAPALTADLREVRGWDLAATSENESGGGRADWTAGVKIGKDSSGRYYILDVKRMRGSPGQIEDLIKRTAKEDGKAVAIVLPQDPGQAGKSQSQSLIRMLAGYRVKALPVSGSKMARARAFSAQVEAGNVGLVSDDWNELFLRELEAFPGGRHDDQVDAAVDAFNFFLRQRATSRKEMY
ncbi:phage terminase large subunit [Sneathiella sp. P13V-1]|uniref:phage terminase large subunit n=1 Tax=Sneathiella sp. P13V-1 TaxID=2697366 RepID=UPI001D100F6F|nr:phage terminase large subunit [Sneathiella sp. P13V-1]